MKHTIKKNYEFRRLYQKGKSAVSSRMVVYCRKNKSDKTRLGITVSTKIGKAVKRNFIRRRFREIFRLSRHNIADGYDVVIVARTRALYSSYQELEKDFKTLAGKLGIYKDEKNSSFTD